MYPSLLKFPGDLFTDFDSLQRQLEQLLGGGSQPSSIRAMGRGSFPQINIGTTADAIDIYAFAPGIDPGKLEVSVDKGLLTIACERSEPKPREGARKPTVYAQERPTGQFRRVASLPEDADPERVEATYRNGVLHVRVQKREASKPRRIEVRG